jgi:transcriptional regulator with GAF, ATPase, and Fis domain
MRNNHDSLSRREREPLEVWWEAIGSCDAEAQPLITELPEAGLSCYSALASARGPGLLFIRQWSHALCARVRERSHGGTDRVIVVAMPGVPLPHGAAWDLMDAGAADVVQLVDPIVTAESIAARFRRWAEIERLLDSQLVRNNLAGSNAAWCDVLRQIVHVARFSALPVLIGGESGTGKELVARLIHALDGREEKKELVILDCSSVVPELSGSEFFGHERGAYTGAAQARDGAFALANDGTLFLDEVGELPPRLQAELLRVVQEGTYKRVGGNAWQRTRFRLVCATNRNLLEEAAAGRFRRDLYYRIAAWTCTLPPLRERREDIPALAGHFLGRHFTDRDAPPFDDAVLELLVAREYPGNVRDLRHLIERIAHRHVGGGPITLGDVPEEERPSPAARIAADPAGNLFERAARMALLCGMSLKEISNTAADAAVRLALSDEAGNVGRAAERLQITDRGLQKRRAIWREKHREPQNR